MNTFSNKFRLFTALIFNLKKLLDATAEQHNLTPKEEEKKVGP